MAGGFRIDDDVERLEAEPDQLGCVYGLPGTLRDHERYGLAHETDMPDGERRPREYRRHDWKADASREPRSAAVSTAMTPGAAVAASTSTVRIAACASVDLTKATWRQRSGWMSST